MPCTHAKVWLSGDRTVGYPSATSSRSTERGMRFDRSMTLLVAENRGDETASSMVIPKSRTLSVTWSTPMAIWVAPGAPITSTGCSFSKTMDGQIEENRALPGASDPARPGLGSNTPMQPLYMKPKPLVMTPEGMPSEWVMETQFPSASRTDTWVVSLLGRPALNRATSTFSPRLMAPATSAQYGFEISRSVGTSTKEGSPMNRSLSRVAAFMASATTRTYSTLL